jgi:hypothetical protein
MREAFLINGHAMTVATIDLAQPWQMISADLLDLTSPYMEACS